MLDFNEQAFSRPLSKEAKYYGGILASDGCVSVTNRGHKRVMLGSKDFELIEGFKNFLSSKHKIGKPINRSIFQFGLFSKRLVNDLITLGITPRKSLDLEVVDELATSLDFWRGDIDGDGSILWNGNCPHIVLASASIALAVQFRRFCTANGVKSAIYEVTGKGTSYERKNPVYRICLSGRPCRALLQLLYYPGAIALSRKMKLAEEILTFYSLSELRGNGWSDLYRRRLTHGEIAWFKARAIFLVSLKYSVLSDLFNVKLEATIPDAREIYQVRRQRWEGPNDLPAQGQVHESLLS
jgi:hypothetical protein